MAAIFEPNLLDWLFGSGVGTNVGAAIVWIPLGALLGFVWSKTSYWPLHALHLRHDQLAASHEQLHATLARIEAVLPAAVPVVPGTPGAGQPGALGDEHGHEQRVVEDQHPAPEHPGKQG